MESHFGVMLVDEMEVIMHIYIGEQYRSLRLVTSQRARYKEQEEKKFGREIAMLQIMADYLDQGSVYHIADWKICSRHTTPSLVSEISSATGLEIETLTQHREQELILKGMSTELI